MGLEDQLNSEFAPGWRPNPGDQLIGRVTDIATRDGSWGPYRVLTIETDGGERHAVHAFHQILADELAKVRPQVGHRIGIKYVGRPEGKNYDVYRVATDNPPVEDWGVGPTGPRAGEAPAPAPAPSGGFVPDTQSSSVPSGVAAADGSDVPF